MKNNNKNNLRLVFIITLITSFAQGNNILTSKILQVGSDMQIIIPTIILTDSNGSVPYSLNLQLSDLGAGCLTNENISTEPCTFDSELIWEAFDYGDLGQSAPLIDSANSVDDNIIEACRSETEPQLNDTWQMCIPSFTIDGQAQEYWAILNPELSMAGRYFFRLQEHGLVNDPVTSISTFADPSETEQFGDSLPSLFATNWSVLNNSTSEETRQLSHRILLTVMNNSENSVNAIPKFLFDIGTSQPLGKILEHIQIPAFSNREITVDLDTFGYKLDNMQYSGKIQVIIDMQDVASGVSIETLVTQDVYWHHDDVTEEIILYDEDRLNSNYRAGDFNSILADDELFEPGAKVGRVLSGLPNTFAGDVIFRDNYESLDTVFDAEEPEDELANNHKSGKVVVNIGDQSQKASFTFETCAKTQILTLDSGIKINSGFPSAGQTEDFWKSCNGGCKVKSRGVRMKLRVGNLIGKAYANPFNGCVTWNVFGTLQDKYALRIYTKSRDVNGNIVRVHNDKNDFDTYAGDLFTRVFTNIKLKDNSSKTFDVGTYSISWTTFATMSFGLMRYNDGLFNKLINVASNSSSCGSSSAHFGNSNSFLTKGRQYLQIGTKISNCENRPQGYLKSIISHELGHSIAALYYGNESGAINAGEPNVDTKLNTAGITGPGCNFVDKGTNDSYTIYSVEYNAVGFREGFAHFVASKIWNYKQQTGAFNFFGSKQDLESYNANNTANGRMKNVCAEASPFVGQTVVGDWMRFFWDFYTNAAASCQQQPTKLQMLKLYSKTRLLSPTRTQYFNSMKSVVDDIGLSSCLSNERFDFYAEHNGIDT